MLKSMKNKDLVKSKAFICPCQIGLSLARKKVIVNNILLSSLWYFVNVWRGTKKGILIINCLLNNYLWARLNHNCRCPIGQDQCCEKKQMTALSLVHPIEASKVLLSKCVVPVLETTNSNLLELFRFRLKQYQPHRGKVGALIGNGVCKLTIRRPLVTRSQITR